MFSGLFAVHISEGVLSPAWWSGGMFLGLLLVLWASYRIPPEMIPRVGLLTAAFFVASLIHVRMGPTSVHLLLNGLVGLILGHRAGLAIFQGLVLQYLLVAHGGLTTLGVNTVILTVPAILGGLAFPWLMRQSWLESRWSRWLIVSISAFAWLVLAGASLEILIAQFSGRLDLFALEWQQMRVLHPESLALMAVVAFVVGRWERHLEPAPGFPIGLLIGVMVALLTVLGNFLVLLLGTVGDWRTLAVLVLIAHLPIVVIESIIAGFTVSYLLRVQPDMLRLSRPR